MKLCSLYNWTLTVQLSWIILLWIFQGYFTVQFSRFCCLFRDSLLILSTSSRLVKNFFNFYSFYILRIFRGAIFILPRQQHFVNMFFHLPNISIVVLLKHFSPTPLVFQMLLSLSLRSACIYYHLIFGMSTIFFSIFYESCAPTKWARSFSASERNVHNTSCRTYPFTAPAAIPFTISLTRKKYNSTIGTAINTLPAAKRANSVSSKLISPTATV